MVALHRCKRAIGTLLQHNYNAAAVLFSTFLGNCLAI